MVGNHLAERERKRERERELVALLYSKACVKRPLKNRQHKDLNDKWLLNEGRKYCRMHYQKTKNGFQDYLSHNAGQKYCRMLPYRLMQVRSIAECSLIA